MVFCDTLFCTVLCRFIGEMYEGEQMDFENRHHTRVTSASTQVRGREKNL